MMCVKSVRVDVVGFQVDIEQILDSCMGKVIAIQK